MTEHDLLGAYALNALSASERAAFEAHLAACGECRAELASLADTTAVLADGAAVTPASGLRARVLANVATVPQEGVTAAPKKRKRWPMIAAAAAVLVVAGVGVVAGSEWTQHQEHLAMEKDVMMVTSAPDAHSMPLALGTSHLVMSEEMGKVAAMGQDAPMPAKGMEYQVFLVMDDGSYEPGPTFMPADDGEFMTIVSAPMDGVVGIAVTEEPAGGSETMTGEMVAEVEL